MNTTRRPGLRRVAPCRAFSDRAFIFCSLLAACLFGSSMARAQEQDKAYLRVHELIQQADALNSGGKTNQALAKYRDAQLALQNLRHAYPGWNAKAIAFRTKYLADKVAALTEKPAPPEPTNAPAAGSSSPAPEKKPTTATAAPQVKLLEPGAEPRQALRLHPKPGDKQSLAITMKIAVEMKMGEMENQPMTLPEITMTADLTVKSVSAQGEIAYDLVMGETTVADVPGSLPQMTEAIKASFASVKGTTAQGRMSSRGLNKVDMKIPAGADAQTRQSIEQLKDMLMTMSIPMPEEAMGAGAKWEVKTPIKSQGLTIDQTSSYQLVALDGDQLTVKATIDQRAANQKMQNPALAAMNPTLTKMTGTGTADLKLNLAQTMPQGSATMKTESAMTMNLGNQKQAANMKSDVNVRVVSK